ncbi:MAG: alpha/beta hydrolase, partial [Clostridiales bacterium]|nr:alpha/beta hydrolase [Clostridiales bacterium]
MWIVWTIGILALLYLLVSAGVALIMPELLLKAKGKRRRTYEQVRREQTALGHVDYEAYDKLEKESFILRGDGADISGEFLPADPSPAPGERPRCLIRVHGYTQNRMLSVRFMKVFREMGYASVIYDQRGFGESTGMCTMGYLEKYDLSLAIDWVKARLGADTLIGVHGESMGGITAMEALGIDSRIDFLVEDGGATDMREFSRFELRR